MTDVHQGRAANPLRGEAAFDIGGKRHALRPTFEALVLAEQELGSLFQLVERAAEGKMSLSEIAGLFWHCLPGEGRPDRADVGQAVVAIGLVQAAVPLRILLAQILRGGGG